jgi:hypothetical protein
MNSYLTDCPYAANLVVEVERGPVVKDAGLLDSLVGNPFQPRHHVSLLKHVQQIRNYSPVNGWQSKECVTFSGNIFKK